MDKVVSKVAALGVPGIMLMIAINASGYAGAAAITTALAALGPGGMKAGIFFLGVTALIMDTIAEFGFEAIMTAVLKRLYEQGETKHSILKKIRNYKITRGLKLKLIDKVEQFG